jgi:hypothetical protein
MIRADPKPKEGKMARSLPDFPLLFDKIGNFLIEFNKLRELRQKPPAEFMAAFDRLVKPASPSPVDDTLEAWDEIVETLYPGRLSRSCPSGSTRMRG